MLLRSAARGFGPLGSTISHVCRGARWCSRCAFPPQPIRTVEAVVGRYLRVGYQLTQYCVHVRIKLPFFRRLISQMLI
jgi:hypothetical protein